MSIQCGDPKYVAVHVIWNLDSSLKAILVGLQDPVEGQVVQIVPIPYLELPGVYFGGTVPAYVDDVVVCNSIWICEWTANP